METPCDAVYVLTPTSVMLNADLAAGVGNNCDRGDTANNAFRNCAVGRGCFHDMRFSWSAGRGDSSGEFPVSGLRDGGERKSLTSGGHVDIFLYHEQTKRQFPLGTSQAIQGYLCAQRQADDRNTCEPSAKLR